MNKVIYGYLVKAEAVFTEDVCWNDVIQVIRAIARKLERDLLEADTDLSKPIGADKNGWDEHGCIEGTRRGDED